MTRFIPLIIVIAFMLMGFVQKFIHLKQLRNRLAFTESYREKFSKLIDGYISTSKIDSDIYIELTEKVIKMQSELGQDGIAYIMDRLTGLEDPAHQMLINFLPEIREMKRWQGYSLMHQRFISSAEACDDMFLRHIGRLNEIIDAEYKHLFNPFSCLTDGVRWGLWLPVNILLWCGLVSSKVGNWLKNNLLIKVLTILVTLISLVASIVTIIIGWDQFVQTLTKWFGGN